MGNNSEIENVFVTEIASWERTLVYHNGSFFVTLPKPLMRCNMIKKNCKFSVRFSHVLDEKTKKVLNVFEIVRK